MNEKRKPKQRSRSAADAAERNADMREGQARGDNQLGSPESASAFASDVRKPIGARPRSEITGRHDAGSGANETVDGLSSTEEAIRQSAEDVPIDDRGEDIEEVPVFDRADTPPKV